ncbi:MAG TPA: diguanylate cyclase [Gaiellales bacterium]|jgi:diguanylate cyclase (GGDEF)-like protein|nr:diguanylate cyclase [Gaiellales bacterium]
MTRRLTQGDRNRRELEVLHRLAVELPRVPTVTGVTDLLAEHLVLATERAGECTISSWDAGRDRLTIMSCYELGTGIVEAQRGETFSLGDWPQSRALLAEGSAYGEYRCDDPAWNQRVLDQLNAWGWQTWIALPLVVEGRSVGLIEVIDRQTAERWSPRDIAFCQTIAGQAALTVRSAQLHEGIRRQVLHDQLTGLLSHRGMHEQLEASLVAANAGGGELSVVAFDLDGFRAVNDRDGQAAGDLVLRRVADVLREESRDCDIAARIGGDEFLLVLPGVGGVAGPAIADRVVSRMAKRTGVSLSAGVAQAQPGELDARVLIDRAQSALLESRRSKGSRRRSA